MSMFLSPPSHLRERSQNLGVYYNAASSPDLQTIVQRSQDVDDIDTPEFNKKYFRTTLQSSLLSIQRDLADADPMTSFDMNDLPHMNGMRHLLLFLCFISFFVAPSVYMPLGSIQSDFYQKCFLYTEIKIINTKGAEDDSVSNNTFFPTFDAMNTLWGPQVYCDFTTYVPVSMAIASVIIGWSTFTIWPAMLSMSKGGLMMALYVVLCICNLAVAIVSGLLIKWGYSFTCSKSLSTRQTSSYTVSCEGLSAITIAEITEKSLVQDIPRAMYLAQIGSWGLVGVASAKVLVSLYSFLIIWFHFHYTPFFLEEIESAYDAETSDSS